MAGIVVSKSGTGGITINIPLQFETIDHLAKVIIDDITAGGGTGPNPHGEAIQLPATLKTLANMTTGTFSALPAVVNDATMTMMNAASAAIQNPTTGLLPQIQDAAQNLNGTVVAAMKKLDTLASASDFAAFKTAAGSAATFPNTDLGGVTQAFTQLERFQTMTSGMQGEGNLGSAVNQLNAIAKNAGTLGACGNLATAVASDIGMSAPPAINDAFALLQDGVANTKTQIIAQSMKAVKDVLDISHSSGRLDDLNDVIWQVAPSLQTASAGTYSGQQVMQISLEQAGINNLTPTDGQPGKVNIPGWINPNTGATEFIPATKLAESLAAVETDLLNKTNAIKSAIESSLAPIEELTSAIGLAASAGNLPAALNSALSSAVKTAMTNARADVSANPHVDPTPPAGAPPDEGGGGRPK